MNQRLAPRWLHIWAIVTLFVTAVLLALGGLVTTFRVGMADPVWPTVPWYLFFIDWQEPSAGFLIEHTHRLAGFTVGGLMAVLSLGIWCTDPHRASRWLGLLGLIGLLATFGQFHGAMIKQVKADEIVLPTEAIIGMAVSLGIVVMIALMGLMTGTRGAGIRFAAVIALVAVMIQGLLGGFRVRLNAWAGTDLAAVHGVFAQVVFSLLACLAVLTARPSSKPELTPVERARCGRLAIVLTAVVFLQLVWGAWTRHHPNGTVQRLHILTAFVVLAVAIWLIKKAQESEISWDRLRRSCWLLLILLVIQITLGVEAWMGKFGTGVLPELQKITPGMAIVRTLHVLVGTGILATSVSLVLLTRQPIKREEAEYQASGAILASRTASAVG